MELGEYRHRAKTGKWPDHSERRIGRNNSNSHETNGDRTWGHPHQRSLQFTVPRNHQSKYSGLIQLSDFEFAALYLRVTV